jgi:WD40 repeat protein
VAVSSEPCIRSAIKNVGHGEQAPDANEVAIENVARAIHDAVFAPDGSSLVLDLGDGVLGDGVLSLWDVTGARERLRYGKKAGPAEPLSGSEPVAGLGAGLLLARAAPGIAVSPDGRLLAQGGLDGVVRLWETASGRELGRFTGHRARVATLAFAPDGKTLASGSADTTALIWDLARVAGP